MAKSKDGSIQITLNQELLDEAQELFEELGLDLDSAVQLFFKQSLNVGGLPFKLRRSRQSRSAQNDNVAESRRSERRDNRKKKEEVKKIEASDAIINDL